MEDFSFGLAPLSDICEEVVIDCIYDEIFETQLPQPRWYEVEGETPLFEVSTEPVSYYDLMTKDFSPIEVLAVGPAEGAEEDNSVPKEVGLAISYYQRNKDDKRLILIDLEFGSFEALTDDENFGTVDVPYQIVFSLQALSHRDLTINFAFSANFYMVLYVLVGILSLGVMVVFAAYHRLVARPPPNQPIAKFKFRSFLMLTIPPAAIGSGMGMLPVMIADVLISIGIVGDIFMVETTMFECTAAEGATACPL